MWVITFDLKSKPAKAIKAYSQIMSVMAANNFIHKQGSVYVSKRGLSNLHTTINAIRAINGIDQCAKDFQVFQMLEGSDFTTIVKTKI